MRRTRVFQHRFWTAFILALFVVPGAGLAQEDPPLCPDPLPAPYVFLLLDTSGSMIYSPPCTQWQYDVGDCSVLCPTGNCFVPLQADDPASKLYQLKEGLQTVLAGQTGVQLGFASFNQDALHARAKHWMYVARIADPRSRDGVPTPPPGRWRCSA